MRLMIATPLLLLAACSAQPGSNSAASGSASTGGGAATTAAITDACAALPRDFVQQTIGRPLTSVEPDATPDMGNGMQSTGCTYDFGEARLVQLTIQQYPDGVDAGGVQSGSRELEGQGGQTPLENVPGLGVDAFYVPARTTLYVQLDNRRQLYVKLTRLPDVPDAKGKLVAFANRIIG